MSDGFCPVCGNELWYADISEMTEIEDEVVLHELYQIDCRNCDISTTIEDGKVIEVFWRSNDVNEGHLTSLGM